MSFNLSSQNTIEALFVFISLMAEKGYRVMSTQIRHEDGERSFNMWFVTMHGMGTNFIECDFEYSQSAHNMRVRWRNQNINKSGKILFENIDANHCGNWERHRPKMAEIFTK